MPNLFDPNFNPFLPTRPAAMPGPAVLSADDTNLLGNLMEGGLGGLAYVGKVLDKTFGGRAVRGLLGGHPDELLSVLPMSDTLGLTHENRAVQGTDLLSDAGLTTRGDDSLENLAAGFGTELLLDPATLFGAAVPKAVARFGGLAGRNAGRAIQSVTGANPYTYAGRQLDRAVDPFKRAGNALFAPAVHGAWTNEGQALAREVYDPALTAGQVAAGARYGNNLGELDQLVKNGVDRDKMLTALRQHAEGLTGDARGTLTPYAPHTQDDILNVGDRLVRGVDDAASAERGVGALSKELEDVPTWARDANEAARTAGTPVPYPTWETDAIDYFPRVMAPYPSSGDAISRGRTAQLSGVSPYQAGRADDLRGIPGGSETLNRLARDPQFSTAGRTLTQLNAEEQLAQLLHGPGVIPFDHPVRGQAKDLARRLNDLPDDALTHGMFSKDVLGSGYSRELEAARVHATGQTVVEGMRYAKPVADLQAAGVPFVRVPDLLAGLGLTHTDAATGMPVAQFLSAQRIGLPVSGPMDLLALRNYALPKDVATDMSRIGQAWKTPEVLAPVVDMWDRVANTFKSYLTQVFPAFHSRNLMSGVFNMWRDGALDPAAGDQMLRVIRGGALNPDTAARLYPGVPVDQATRMFRDELIGQRLAFSGSGAAGDKAGSVVAGGRLPGDLPDVGGAVRPLGQDIGGFLGGFVPEKGHLAEQLNPLNISGVNRDSDMFTLAKQGRALGNTVEDWIRGTHYLAKREQGFPLEAARESVLKYQIDYGRATEFEKNVMKRVFPWYSFSRRSLPPLLEDLATQPAKVAGATRLISGVREPGEFVPPWVAEGASIPLPGAPEGQQRYLSSFGLPMEDETLKTIGSAMQGDVGRVFQQLFGMAQPLVKLPAELATGTQMYSGRKLEDLKPYEFSTFGGLLPDDTARQFSQLLANSPLSRVASTFDKLTDERKGLGGAALNTLTGARLTDVDTEKAGERAAQDLLKELLRGKPGVKAREEVYVPKDQLPRMRPEDLMMYDMLKEIEARAQKRARDEKAKVGR